jgi:K+-sensing histidine kinase KdpD
LVDNAIKYADLNSTISLVCAEEEEGAYAFKVKSIGLPILETNVIFKKFGRGKNASQKDDTGIGIGLWAARQIMLKRNGDLTVEAHGRLSVFIVHVPTSWIVGNKEVKNG